ncbi:hypothetical protein SDC9_71586 [bioreactor metagenome]|uniref:Uncharacterized protein n=1 Tax=bioreactor metagenome TaxID=1076179 RepID=A0A644Y941_9ZZZZ
MVAHFFAVQVQFVIPKPADVGACGSDLLTGGKFFAQQVAAANPFRFPVGFMEKRGFKRSGGFRNFALFVPNGQIAEITRGGRKYFARIPRACRAHRLGFSGIPVGFAGFVIDAYTVCALLCPARKRNQFPAETRRFVVHANRVDGIFAGERLYCQVAGHIEIPFTDRAFDYLQNPSKVNGALKPCYSLTEPAVKPLTSHFCKKIIIMQIGSMMATTPAAFIHQYTSSSAAYLPIATVSVIDFLPVSTSA